VSEDALVGQVFFEQHFGRFSKNATGQDVC